jgi:hypothetical protein
MVENWNLEENMAPGVGSLTRRVTWLTRVYKKKIEFRSILTFIECRVRRPMDKWNPWYSRRWILTSHLGAWVHNNPIHANLQLVAYQEGTNFLQHPQIIFVHDNDGPSIRQKPSSKNHNKLNKIIHSPVLKKEWGRVVQRDAKLED